MGSHGSASGSYNNINTFGELLKVLRRRAQLTQRELAAAVGYSESYITRLENNERHPDAATVNARFVAALGLAGEPELARRLLELAAPGAPTAGQAAPVLPASPPSATTNLPAPLTHFIGRAHEIYEVERLLASTRLLTLTGSGGVGKTRLAIEVGLSIVGAMHRQEAEVSDGSTGGALPVPATFPNGVWLVELAPLADAGPLIQTVAAAFGLQTMSRPALAVLTDYLADRQAVLILDNCEHLIGACATLAQALLHACPRLHILATSREGLNITGEVTWRVPPLAQDEAMQLFAERANAVKPGFAITSANHEWVDHICRRLDNIPLAIELAAARVRAFSVEQLAARMDDVFRLLTGGSRTALPRQQTLKATIDWSYSLLSEAERALLRGLSVFAGGWTLEAAEAIHGAGVLDLLGQLVNKSLVVADADADAGGGAVRYRLLETIRQYAGDAARTSGADAADLESIRRRHLTYYADLAQVGQVIIESGIWHWIWNGAVAAELDNTRAALSWAAQSRDWLLGWRLITGALGVWVVLGYGGELTGWMDKIVLANPAASELARAYTLAMLGRMQYDTGDGEGSLVSYRAAARLAHQIGDDELIMETDQYLAFLTPDEEQATRLLHNVIQMARYRGRKNREAWAMCKLGNRQRMRGDLQQASGILAEGVALAQAAGDNGVIAVCLFHLVQLYHDQGLAAQALAVLDRSITLCRQQGLQGSLGVHLCFLAEVGLHLGDTALARAALQEHIPLHHRMDYLERVAHGMATAAGLAQAQGQPLQAARLLGAAQAIRRDHHSLGIFEAELFAAYEQRLQALRAELEPTAFECAWTAGQQWTLNQAIKEALSV